MTNINKNLEEVRKNIADKRSRKEIDRRVDTIPENKEFDLKKWIIHQLPKNKRKFKPKQDKRHRDAEKADETKRNIGISLSKGMDEHVFKICSMRGSKEDFELFLQTIMDQEKKIKDYGFEWRPNLGAFLAQEQHTIQNHNTSKL